MLRRKCAIVDDDADWVVLAQRALRQLDGWLDPIAFCDVDTAMEFLRREGVDVIVTDLHMPQKDGMDLIREVRERDSRTPIIVMSSDLRMREDVLRASANEFVPKRELNEQLPGALCRLLDPLSCPQAG